MYKEKHVFIRLINCFSFLHYISLIFHFSFDFMIFVFISFTFTFNLINHLILILNRHLYNTFCKHIERISLLVISKLKCRKCYYKHINNLKLQVTTLLFYTQHKVTWPWKNGPKPQYFGSINIGTCVDMEITECQSQSHKVHQKAKTIPCLEFNVSLTTTLIEKSPSVNYHSEYSPILLNTMD